MYCVIVLGAINPKSRCWQGRTSSEGCRWIIPFLFKLLVISWQSPVLSGFWMHPSNSLLSHDVLFCVCASFSLSKFFISIKTQLYWNRACPNAILEEGNGNPLQYSCLENPVDGGAWWAAVHRVARSWTWLKQLSMHACIGEGNGNPLQDSCLENPGDGGAWWAAVYGVAQSQTWLKWLSSSSDAILSTLFTIWTSVKVHFQTRPHSQVLRS